MEKRYQVFISSTFADLEEERKEVMEAIINLDCFPAGMEMFPAADIEQFEYIKTIIDQSDYYILIIAGRYGSVAEDGKSYTEKEYEYAREKGIPVLVFVKSDIENIPASQTDNDPKCKELLLEFRSTAMKNRLAKFWNDKMELKYKVHESLSRAFKMSPRSGWVKGDMIVNTDILIELENLRKEKSELEGKIKLLQEKKDKEVEMENIAQGDDVIQINYKWTDDEYYQFNDKIDITWNQLFKLIAPEISGVELSSSVKKILEDKLQDLIEYSCEEIEVNGNDFNTIKYQFDELDLIKLKLVRNNECLEVSDKGKRMIRSLYVLKR